MKKTAKLIVRFMGGVDEIGSNMTVLETAKEYFVIDYGILFPDDDAFDINYLIADFSDLDPNKKTTLFITHGHEDHIGAVSHIIDYFQNFKIYAPRFATTLIQRKLYQRKMTTPIKVYEHTAVIKFGDFEIHPVHVTHSIPQTHGVIIRNDDLALLFISDFKFDLNPLYENPFDYQKIERLFNTSKLKIAMLDSTNILNPAKTLSESDLAADIQNIVARDKRTFVTLFSSNIHRLRTIFEATKKANKKITAVGRSIYNYLDAAKEAGIFNYEDYAFFKEDSVTNPEKKDWVVLLTGCQGDFMGALNRLRNSEHRLFKFTDEDQIIFSSKPIPGNQKKISKIYNDITKHGCEIITFKDAKVHASGHPGQKDLLELFKHIKPDYYIPIHGETYFLKKHAKFAQTHLKTKALFLGNFHSIHISEDLEVTPTKDKSREPILIHGNYLPIERSEIAKRRKIATQGVAFVTIDRSSKKIHLTTEGLPLSIKENYEAVITQLSGCAFREFKNSPTEKRVEGVRVRTRQAFKKFLGYRPVALVHEV